MHDEERGNEIAYSLLTSSPKKKKKSSFCLVDQQVSNGFQWKNKLQ